MATTEPPQQSSPPPHGTNLVTLVLRFFLAPFASTGFGVKSVPAHSVENLLSPHPHPHRPQLTNLADRTTDRPGRRRPFSAWMKKLANFKGNHTADGAQPAGTKRNTYQMKSNAKKQSPSKQNNPYPQSGHLNGQSAPPNGNNSFSTGPTGNNMSNSSLNRSRQSVRSSQDGLPPTIGNKSTAPTLSTEPDVAHSDVAASHAPSSGEATNATVGCGVSSGRGPDSTFSSPAPSVRSLTTTLTTIHSAAAPTAPPPNNATNTTNGQTIQFSHQFPSSPPPTALPAHLAPSGSGGHPATYSTATANNLLTDNASILTLASSSKRRRRRSMDTDASVRALAPSSLFGGSRESLPLSVLSSNIEQSNATSVAHQPWPTVGLNERASIYSATGVAPALPSERNSYYAGKQSVAADGGSVKSGLLGHGRNDSISGSIGGVAPPGSPLAGPRDFMGPNSGRLSRKNSGWENGEAEKGDEPEAEPEELAKGGDKA
ncbi:hypothetical protein LAWI1_G007243 [Lachnellula willkommii]|uniref:Ca2+-modulated nonselective cation channel polycystin n=1 Tax=Lachnellula willkommii TaxID=215461 RepID=A0A559M172_9HELO|nr:hypothetical protein LAWI1_G007243 [Lachnellula willkommii]